jgi:hypothetical protein
MRKTVAAAVAAGGMAVLTGGAGLAAASTGPAARPAAARTEHFQLMSTSATSSKNSLIAYGGAFTAGGTDQQNKNNTDTFKFAGGSFHVTHKVTGGTQHINKATCMFTVRQHGTFKVSHGTGKYRGISGSGHFTLSVLVIAVRAHGKCTQRSVASQTLIQAQGPVSLP